MTNNYLTHKKNYVKVNNNNETTFGISQITIKDYENETNFRNIQRRERKTLRNWGNQKEVAQIIFRLIPDFRTVLCIQRQLYIIKYLTHKVENILKNFPIPFDYFYVTRCLGKQEAMAFCEKSSIGCGYLSVYPLKKTCCV